MTLRDHLRPAGRGRVMAFVQAAGIDVSDWVNFTGGRAKAATNPKYCYEWAFIDRNKGVAVFNLWHHKTVKTRGRVTMTTNLLEIHKCARQCFVARMVGVSIAAHRVL